MTKHILADLSAISIPTKKLKANRVTVGKSIVIAALERSADEGKPSKVKMKVAKDTGAKTLTGLVANNVADGPAVYTDTHKSTVALQSRSFISSLSTLLVLSIRTDKRITSPFSIEHPKVLTWPLNRST